jgi:hypothetical protein
MTTTSTSVSSTTGAVEPARRGVPSIVPLVGDEPAMRDWAAELVERARTEGVELTGDNGLLTALVRQVLQTGLEVEMTDHLGYPPHAAGGPWQRQLAQRQLSQDGDDRDRHRRSARPA